MLESIASGTPLITTNRGGIKEYVSKYGAIILEVNEDIVNMIKENMEKILNENKIIYKKGTNWLPYSDVDKSWYKLIVGSNNEHNYSQLKFSPKGVYEISKLLEIEFKEEDLKKLA